MIFWSPPLEAIASSPPEGPLLSAHRHYMPMTWYERPRAAVSQDSFASILFLRWSEEVSLILVSQYEITSRPFLQRARDWLLKAFSPRLSATTSASPAKKTLLFIQLDRLPAIPLFDRFFEVALFLFYGFSPGSIFAGRFNWRALIFPWLYRLSR